MFNQHIQTLLQNGALSNTPLSRDYEADYGTPDYTITSFPSSGTGVANSDDVIIAIDANISSTDDGVLIDLGGSSGAGLAVGVNNGTLRARAFAASGNDWDSNIDAAFVEADISSYTGSGATYYIVVDASAFSLTVYVQAGGQGSTSSIVQLGSDIAGGGQSLVYGSNQKGYGYVRGFSIADLGSAYEVNFNGTIDEIRYWAEDSTLDASGFGSVTGLTATGFIAPVTVSAPTFVGATGTQGVSSLSLTGITGLQEGDLVLFIASDSNSSTTGTGTAGWTDVITSTDNSIRNLVSYKVMGATPDSSVSVLNDEGDDVQDMDALSAIAFRNVEYDTMAGFQTASSNTIDPPSISITEDDSVSILCAFIDDDNSTISSPSTGYTVATENGRAGGSNALMYKTGVSSGTEDPSSYTWATSDALLNRTVILKPTGPVPRNAAGFTS